jgi:tetratricopeptide (TPR) repeat protein
MNLKVLISSRSFTFFSLLLIAVVCLVAYSNTFRVPFQFDDPGNIDGKPFVKDIGMFFDPARFSEDSVFIMRTVAYFTFAVNYRVHGTDVVGYHVVNLLFHILNAFFVYFLVLMTFKTPYFSNPSSPPLSLRGGRVGLFIPLFAALLFASHPVLTQAVTYIVQRAASLATLFYLLSLVMYIKGRLASQRQVEAEVKDEKDSASNLKPQSSVSASALAFFVFSFLSAILAMKTKEMAFTLPLIIVLYEFIFFTGSVKKRVLYLLPLLLTMLIIPFSLMSIGEPTGEIIGDVSEAARVNTDISRWNYLFTQFPVIVTYIRLLFFPVNQNVDYDYPLYHSFFDPKVILSFLFLLLIFGIGVYLMYKSRQKASGEGQEEKNRGREGVSPIAFHLLPIACYRLIAFGIFWFFITLSVESSIIPIADVIFEHRLYLPSVGFFIAVTAVLFTVWERLKGKAEWVDKVVAGGLIAVILLLSGATYLRNNVWQSELSLWRDIVQKSPMKARANNGLGIAYQREGRLNEAIENFARAVALDPSYDVAHNNLGVAYFKKNLLGPALEEINRAIALDPEMAMSYNNRGLVYAALGEIDRAVEDYLVAIRLDPSYGEAYHNLGYAYHRKGLYDKAVEEYTTAIGIVPDNAIYYSNRGLAYAARGDFEKAVADYMKTLALDPGFADAYAGMGVVNGELGRFDAAVEDFTKAISLDSSNASAYVNRAVAYERMQNIDKALSDFQRVCEMGDARGCNGVEYIRKKYLVAR